MKILSSSLLAAILSASQIRSDREGSISSNYELHSALKENRARKSASNVGANRKSQKALRKRAKWGK
jgi:hypothetical protein